MLRTTASHRVVALPSTRLFLSARALRQKGAPPPPPDKSPVQVFFDVFRKEWEKSSELKNEIKELQDATGRMGESDAFKRAKEAYEKAQKGSTIVGHTIKKTGEKIGDVAGAAWESEVGKSTRKVVSKTAEKVDEAFEPVRKTQAYKDISEVIDDGSSVAYGGFVTKEQRRLKREREILLGKRRVIKLDSEAPTALTTTEYKVSKPTFSEKWEKFKATTWLGRRVADLRVWWDESENGLVLIVRTIFEKIGRIFGETERAQVVKKMKLMDPTFNLEDFTKSLNEYIIPEVLEAMAKGDEKVLKSWLSEASYNVWNAQAKQYREKGIFPDGRILDIRRLMISNCKLLPPDDTPVFVVGCQVQEISLYRDAKSHEIVAGDESDIVRYGYAIALTRVPEELDNKETEGWKIIELAKGGASPYT